MASIPDWAANAAAKISDETHVDLEYTLIDLPTEERIASIIEEHCPFQPGVAYMPVPRCDRCKFWKRYPVSLQEDGDDGTCYRPDSDKGAKFYALPCQGAQDADLITDPDFGCVQFEAKALD
ncbi:MAG: hypothetical protein NUW22_12325 [Acidobacteria bacterium]|nr:hypothetical protein [Acidobacteriota bacterium]